MSEELRQELEQLGASSFQIVILSTDEVRARAALRAARMRNAVDVLRYAISLYEDPEWMKKSAEKATTNRAAIVECRLCGGDRFVIAGERDPEQSAWMRERGIEPSAVQRYEVYKRCPECNPGLA